ncbi:MAG TPA: ATP-binding cassette domain-containing protein [Hyphomicrobiales bacterium]|nr:ATP-binding cassette domain-containing protein [Hyphomicrobiales bacterium]
MKAMPVAPAPTAAPWRMAILLAAIAAASGILLTGLSAWFLGAVALAGLGPAAFAFNFHTPAAFVRLFALGRTAAKYGERVVGHQAALLDQVRRRTRLFAAMAAAPATRAAGWQLGNQDRLADYMEDVEDVDYARLRVGMPATVLMAGAAALIAATAWLAPLALVPVGVVLGAIGVATGWLVPRTARDWDIVRAANRAAGRRLGTALAAIVPLKAERAAPDVVDGAFADFAEAEHARRRLRREIAMLDLAVGLVGPVAALMVLLAAWHDGSRGVALLLPAFVAFAWFAFGEMAQGLSRIVLGWVHERAARRSLAAWTAGPAADDASTPAPEAIHSMTMRDVPRRAPDGRSLGASLDATLGAGRPTAIVGESGTGKTTLLKAIAGWLGEEGTYVADGMVLPAPARRASCHLVLHDAAILADTIRANLFAPRASDAECWRALATVELDDRIHAAGGLDAWITQAWLSLGEAQRLNLARTLLTASPIVLLDEPTEHLDGRQAVRIFERVLRRLSDRVVVYATHDVAAAAAAAQWVALR